MAKRPERTPGQEAYRKKLAGNLLNLRNSGNSGKDLAKTLLEEEQKTEDYKKSETRFLRNDEIEREEWNNYVIETIDTKDYDTVRMYIEHSSNYRLYLDVAKKLIEKGMERLICCYPDRFRPSDEMMDLFLSIDYDDPIAHKQWIVNYLFDMGKDPKVEGCLTKKSVEKLMDARILPRAYIANLCVFRGLDKGTLFKILDSGISISDYETLLFNLGNFNGLDKEAFNALVSYKDSYLGILKNRGREALYKHIDKFEGLGEEEAKLFIEHGYGHYVAQHLEKFGLKKEK